MKKETFSESIEKHGFLTGDPHFHESGISSKTNREYPAFAYMFYLPLNREQTERVNIAVDFYQEIADATADMKQCQRIVICGDVDADGHFTATEVRPFAN